MGKDWDAPWKYAFTAPGFTDGGNRKPAPGFTSSRNPTCQACGFRQRTWKGGPDKCECLEPDFDYPESTDRQKFQEWCVLWLRECYRVLKPGGVVKIFGATRMFHRMAAAMEDAGFVLMPEHSLEGWGYGCLTEDTEILTELGWKRGPDVTLGEIVSCWNPVTGKTQWEAVQEVVVQPYDGDMVVFRNDKTDQVLTPNHRVYHRRLGRDTSIEVAEAATLVGQQVQLPIKSRWGVGFTLATGSLEPYQGIVWCVRVPTGAFLARRKGMAFVTGNSGFPKSLDVHKNVSKVLDNFVGTDTLSLWKQNSSAVVPVATLSPKNPTEAGLHTPRSGFAPDSAPLNTVLRKDWLRVIIAELMCCEALHIYEGAISSVHEPAATFTFPWKDPAKSVGPFPENHSLWSSTTFTVQGDVKGLLNERLGSLKGKDGEALKTWLGRWLCSGQGISSALIAVLENALKHTIFSLSKTFRTSDMTQQMACVSATNVTITECMVECLTSFMGDTARNWALDHCGGVGTALKPAWEGFVIGRKPG